MSEAASPPAPDPARLLHAARGFAAAFWGLAVAVLLLSGVIHIRPLGLLGLPAHTAGALLLVLSGAWFWRSRGLSPRWDRLAAHYLAAAALQVYLLPFLGWWRLLDNTWYYTANMLLAVAGTLWLLLVLHVLALELAHRLRDQVLLVEARICLWVSPLLIGGAFGLYAMGAVWLAGLDVGHLPDLLRGLIIIRPPWSNLPAILPFLLALAVAWESKERCLLALAPPPAPVERA